MNNSTHRRVRIGAVTYLNSKPLIEGLAEFAPQAELILDYPSRLADDLAAGRLDVGLVPSIECLRHADYEIVSDACVAARGPVLSVKLYSRVPMENVRSLALDEGSRTSAALARILLAERYGVEPELEPLPLGKPVTSTRADAVLLIGDRAIHPPAEQFTATWDLGEEWSNWTGLPFVFAVWAARKPGFFRETGFLENNCGQKPGVSENTGFLHDIEDALGRARDFGVERLDEIAKRESLLLGIDEETAREYL
ncbi:MAG: menaquinone biosynthetic enzyme MqnA/MqnD family protein, partial [Planctomycetaceae bacterium]